MYIALCTLVQLYSCTNLLTVTCAYFIPQTAGRTCAMSMLCVSMCPQLIHVVRRTPISLWTIQSCGYSWPWPKCCLELAPSQFNPLGSHMWMILLGQATPLSTSVTTSSVLFCDILFEDCIPAYIKSAFLCSSHTLCRVCVWACLWLSPRICGTENLRGHRQSKWRYSFFFSSESVFILEDVIA